MYESGSVVRSLAGHDKNRYYVVVESGDGWVTIADGKERKLAKPKRKNLRHVQGTKTRLELENIPSDKALYKQLEQMNRALAGMRRQGGI